MDHLALGSNSPMSFFIMARGRGPARGNERNFGAQTSEGVARISLPAKSRFISHFGSRELIVSRELSDSRAGAEPYGSDLEGRYRNEKRATRISLPRREDLCSRFVWPYHGCLDLYTAYFSVFHDYVLTKRGNGMIGARVFRN